MAKLEQIIGGILKDVNQARVISDAYSLNLRSTYRKDPFLKLLSVPRTDIKEVVIDLKFFIKQIEYDFISELYADYIEKGVRSDNVKAIEFGTDDGVVVGLYRQIEEEREEERWVQEDISDGTSKITSELFLEGRPDEWTIHLVDSDIGHIIRISLETQDITVGDKEHYKVLRATADWQEKSEDAQGIVDMDVEVVANQLATLPEATLSSISLKLDLTHQ